MDVRGEFKIMGGFALVTLVIGAILYALDDMRITENTSGLGILLMGAGFGIIFVMIYFKIYLEHVFKKLRISKTDQY